MIIGNMAHALREGGEIIVARGDGWTQTISDICGDTPTHALGVGAIAADNVGSVLRAGDHLGPQDVASLAVTLATAEPPLSSRAATYFTAAFTHTLLGNNLDLIVRNVRPV
jgi:hypothetical protein